MHVCVWVNCQHISVNKSVHDAEDDDTHTYNSLKTTPTAAFVARNETNASFNHDLSAKKARERQKVWFNVAPKTL